MLLTDVKSLHSLLLRVQHYSTPISTHLSVWIQTNRIHHSMQANSPPGRQQSDKVVAVWIVCVDCLSKGCFGVCCGRIRNKGGCTRGLYELYKRLCVAIEGSITYLCHAMLAGMLACQVNIRICILYNIEGITQK